MIKKLLLPVILSLVVCTHMCHADDALTKSIRHASQVIHRSQGSVIHSSKSWDVINGVRTRKSASVGFLLNKKSGKYVPGYALPQQLIELLGEDYVQEVSPELIIEQIFGGRIWGTELV